MRVPAQPKPAPRVLRPRSEPDSSDLAKLEASVNTTSQRAVAQWIAYLSLWAYLFFTTLSVTDRDLILLTPVKLPLIGVELGLQAFFWSGPPLFWVFHLYLVRKVLVLTRDIAFYRQQIGRQIRLEAKREPLYRRLDAFFLTRLLGHAGQGNGLRALDAIIAAVTLALMPLALMLTFQIRFLAFHDVEATWWHRGWAVADLLLVVFLTARALRVRQVAAGSVFSVGRTEWHGFLRGVGRVAVVPVTIAYGLFSLLVATVPDEEVTQSVADLSDISWWMKLPRNLAPSDTDFVNDEKLDKVQVSLDLRGRNLRGADLKNADLRKAALDGAELQGTSLDKARLQGASLDKAQLQAASLDKAQLQGASLYEAQLQGASLYEAQFQGASLDFAQFQGASLDFAQLQGASLNVVKLQGASLNFAQLQAASLNFAELQAASLNGARLQGASLYKAQLQAASLWGAELWRTTPHFQRPTDLIAFRTRIAFTPYAKSEALKLTDQWVKSIPPGEKKEEAIARLKMISDESTLDSDRRKKKLWKQRLGNEKPDLHIKRAHFLLHVLCSEKSVLYYQKFEAFNRYPYNNMRQYHDKNFPICLVDDTVAQNILENSEKYSPIYSRSIGDLLKELRSRLEYYRTTASPNFIAPTNAATASNR